MVAFIASLLITFALAALIVPMAKRRPVGMMFTWGEAMVASFYAFFLMFWAYGMVPHLWLTWADNELSWRPDKLLYGPGAVLKPQVLGGWFPITVNYQTLRDVIAVLIYVALLAAQVFMWIWWQKRGIRAQAASTEVVSSEYGRPLVRKA